MQAKGQLNISGMNLRVHRFSQNANYQDFCPGSLLEGRAEILVIFGWHFAEPVTS